MSSPKQPILKKMLDRLFASLMNGPNLNCRPHASRQRIDLSQLTKLQDTSPEQILRDLLGENRACKVTALARPPKKQEENATDSPEAEETEEQKAEKKVRKAFAEQTSVLNKVRGIVEDARTYQNDTGVHVLQLGFPLLNLPPGKSGMPGMTRRILAPLAFISLSVSVKTGARPAIELECRNEGVDLVVPNIALLAWLERQTGHAPKNLFADEEGKKPWKEIVSIVQAVCKQLGMEVPALFKDDVKIPASLAVESSPRSDDESRQPGIAPAVVIGLFPMANQGLLRDTQAMCEEDQLAGPISKFLEIDPSLEARLDLRPDKPLEKQTRDFSVERLVAFADPCQARAVRLSRTSRCVVIHGPPGTGKSQTITNIIGDHLARGERVLFVCDKRTALDVVHNRLEALGLSSLCAIVHDPQRDQRDLYKGIREQLDNLTELRTNAAAENGLNRTDAELQQLHGELTQFHRALMVRPDKNSLSFHELVGEWLAIPTYKVEFDGSLVRGISVNEVENASQAIRDILDRAAKCKFASNPWSIAVGTTLATFLAAPVKQHRANFHAIIEAVNALAQAPRGSVPPFPVNLDIATIASARTVLAARLTKIVGEIGATLRSRWAEADATRIARDRQILTEACPFFEASGSRPLDKELTTFVRSEAPSLSSVAQQLVVLSSYLELASKWYGFIFFGKKKAAELVLAKFGMTVSIANAQRASDFLNGLKARMMAKEAIESLGLALQAKFIGEADLANPYRRLCQLLDFLAWLIAESALADLVTRVREALKSKESPAKLLAGLRESANRGDLLLKCEHAIRTPLIVKDRQDYLIGQCCADQPPVKVVQSLADHFDALENVLRVQHGLCTIPDGFRKSLMQLIKQSVPGETALKVLKKAALSEAISQRIQTNQSLVLQDALRLETSFKRYREVEEQNARFDGRDVVPYLGRDSKIAIACLDK